MVLKYFIPVASHSFDKMTCQNKKIGLFSVYILTNKSNNYVQINQAKRESHNN